MPKKKAKEEWEVGCKMCIYEWKAKKSYVLKCPKCGSDSITDNERLTKEIDKEQVEEII